MLRTVAPALLLAACTPQNAEITNGSFVAFFSDGTSLSLAKDEVDPTDKGWSASYELDCRDDEDVINLENPIDICGPNQWPPVYEEWAIQAGFRVVSEPLEPWRGEAIITSEGDLQIAFHHTLTGGADMRIVMAVDPAFQPTTCEPKPNGGVERVDLDGDWIQEWSRELDTIAGIGEDYAESYAHMEPYLDGGSLFFLNAFGYQLNPRNVDDFWSLPEQWLAGAAQGKISEELIYHRTPRYGEPFVYNYVEVADGIAPPVSENELWFCDLPEGEDPTNNACMSDLGDELVATSDGVHDELQRMFRPDGKDGDTIYHFRPIPHLNDWRAPDGVPAGIDGWGEMHYNYVVFSRDSNLEVGGSARGAFSLVLDAGESATRVFVKGEFNIDKIKKDRWTTDDLREVKAEANGAELCFE